jgi:ubiquinone/menaquinone biosynthesis C-methylase UbiE
LEEKEMAHNPVKHAASMVCPWWLCFTFDNILRRALQNPLKILKPYVKTGWKVLDVGPGMGYFTVPMAKLVGDTGLVIAADLQKQMLNSIAKRAEKEGVQNRIKLHQAQTDKIGVTEKVDFALAFWMVHEVPDQVHCINEIASLLKPNGLFLIVEPKLHVSGSAFARELQIAQAAGLSVIEKPRVFISNGVLLKKSK